MDPYTTGVRLYWLSVVVKYSTLAWLSITRIECVAVRLLGCTDTGARSNLYGHTVSAYLRMNSAQPCSDIARALSHPACQERLLTAKAIIHHLTPRLASSVSFSTAISVPWSKVTDCSNLNLRGGQRKNTSAQMSRTTLAT